MLKSWEEGKAEGRAEAAAAQSKAILTVFRVRGIEVPATVRERILAEKDVGQLTRWLEKAVLASMIEDVIDDQS